jgi:hypothetical protein
MVRRETRDARAARPCGEENHLLRRMNVFVTVALANLHKELEPHYSDIGRPSINHELMIRMLIVGYCYGIRSERKLCQEVELHLAYRWFCELDVQARVAHHSTLSEKGLSMGDSPRRSRPCWARMRPACRPRPSAV